MYTTAGLGQPSKTPARGELDTAAASGLWEVTSFRLVLLSIHSHLHLGCQWSVFLHSLAQFKPCVLCLPLYSLMISFTEKKKSLERCSQMHLNTLHLSSSSIGSIPPIIKEQFSTCAWTPCPLTLTNSVVTWSFFFFFFLIFFHWPFAWVWICHSSHQKKSGPHISP